MSKKPIKKKENLTNKYWKKRARQDKLKVIRTQEKGIDNLKRLLKTNLDDVEKKITAFYDKYADNYTDTLTYTQAVQYKMKLKQNAYKFKNDKILQKILREDAPKYKIERLRALQTDLQIQLAVATAGQQKGIYKTLEDVAKVSLDSVKERFKEVSNVKFNTIADKKLQKIIGSDWSGKNWSDRLWKDREKVGLKVQELLETGLPQGRSLQDMARDLKDATQSSFNDAFRLIRTEAAHVDGQVKLEGYKQSAKDLGYTEYVYDAFLDDRTSKICQELNGQKFPIDEAEVGVNYPPMHPNCRSTTHLDEGSIDDDFDFLPDDVEPKAKELEVKEETINDKLTKDFEKYENSRKPVNREISAEEIIKRAKNIEITDEMKKYNRFKQMEDVRTRALLENSEYLDKPTVLSKKDFENLDNSYIKVFRGVNNSPTKTAKEINEQFRTGKAYIGQGLYGGGTYTTPHLQTAQGFGKDDLLEIAFKKNSRIINYKDLEEKKQEIIKAVNKPFSNINHFQKDLALNKSGLAKDMGYDVIQVDFEEWRKWAGNVEQNLERLGEQYKSPYYVILNRKIVIVKDK